MVTREAIVRAASRYDTVMAWAFRRTLGIARRAGGRKCKGADKAVREPALRGTRGMHGQPGPLSRGALAVATKTRYANGHARRQVRAWLKAQGLRRATSAAWPSTTTCPRATR